MSDIKVDVSKEVVIKISAPKDISFSAEEIERMIETYLMLKESDRENISGYARFIVRSYKDDM